MTPAEPIIAVSGLRKAYDSHPVLDGIDIRVDRGEIFALLGPNGAGKTTAISILTTLIKPDAGTVTIAGHDLIRHPRRVRTAIGLTGQYAAVDPFQTGEENLRMMCRLAHLSRSEAKVRTGDLLRDFDLVEAATRRAGTYSGGMRRRLDLAISLIANPAIVFLDEPTTGLDPRSRAQMWGVVRSLADAGTTIFLTTQYLDEADQLADRVAVIDDGRIIAEGAPAELKRRVSGEHVELGFDDEESFVSAHRLPLSEGARFDADAQSVTVPTTNSVQTIRELLAQSSDHGLGVRTISVIKPSLDDVFFALTGHHAASDDDQTDNTTTREEAA